MVFEGRGSSRDNVLLEMQKISARAVDEFRGRCAQPFLIRAPHAQYGAPIHDFSPGRIQDGAQKFSSEAVIPSRGMRKPSLWNSLNVFPTDPLRNQFSTPSAISVLKAFLNSGRGNHAARPQSPHPCSSSKFRT
jgi:hypothetical protein